MGTDYNRRVDECAEAAKILLKAAGREEKERLLGHVTAGEYAAHEKLLSGPAARRAAHFFSEVERVERGVAAWRRGDLKEFAELMSASGESSIRNYECGCPPLIDLYNILLETDGVYGARFSGAGFRGCCVALARPDAASEAAAAIRQVYVRRHPTLAENASVLVCHTGDGARFV